MIQPFKDQILVKRVELENKTKGGIWLPENRASGLHVWARVLAVGPKVRHVKADNFVLFPVLLAWKPDDDSMLVKEEICLAVESEEGVKNWRGFIAS